jgi:AraC-like DNA-binding protein
MATHRIAKSDPGLPPTEATGSVRVLLMSLVHNAFDGYHSYGRHQHVEHEILFILEGVYRATLNDSEVVLHPGQALIVCPGDWHQDTCIPPLRYEALSLRLRHTLRGDERLRMLLPEQPAATHCLPASHDLFLPLLEKLRQERREFDRFSPAIQETVSREIFWRLLRGLPPEAVTPLVLNAHEPDLQQRLYQIFERHLQRALSVPDMAHELGMSVSSLAHRCSQELGVSPSRAFLRHRMKRAAELLAHTSMTVKEISDYLAFENPFHFSRAFKSVYRQAPTDYRRNTA